MSIVAGGVLVPVLTDSVLIIDDDYYAREALALLLARDERTRVWDSAESIDAALLLLERTPGPGPDVILLDVQFGSDTHAGIDALPAIASVCTEARILVTSVLRNETTVLAAVKAGADGYVWKNESGSGIASAVCRLAEGRFVMTPSIAQAVLGQAQAAREYAIEVLGTEPQYADLTSALKRTLYLFCLCGMSVREIALELQVSQHTVSSRIKAAYQIIDAGSRQEAFARLVSRADSKVE